MYVSPQHNLRSCSQIDIMTRFAHRMVMVLVLMVATSIVEIFLKSADAFLIKNNSITTRRRIIEKTAAETTTTTMTKTIRLSPPLYMGGFNKAKNKQAELAKKMALAKKQNEGMAVNDDSPNNRKVNTDDKGIAKTTSNNEEEKKNKNDDEDDMKRRRDDFETLLRTTKGAIPSYDNYSDSEFIPHIQAGSKIGIPKKKKQKTIEQKENEKQKALLLAEEAMNNKKVEAQRIHFEELIDVSTSNALGVIGAAKLVPWVPPYLKSCLIVFVDPRTNSNDLRRTIQYLSSSSTISSSSSSSSSSDNEGDVVFVTADSVAETKAWLTRNGLLAPLTSNKIRIFSDPQLSFMSSYGIIGGGDDEDEDATATAAADYRWSMSMLVFDTNGDTVQFERDVDPSHCTELITKTIREVKC